VQALAIGDAAAAGATGGRQKSKKKSKAGKQNVMQYDSVAGDDSSIVADSEDAFASTSSSSSSSSSASSRRYHRRRVLEPSEQEEDTASYVAPEDSRRHRLRSRRSHSAAPADASDDNNSNMTIGPSTATVACSMLLPVADPVLNAPVDTAAAAAGVVGCWAAQPAPPAPAAAAAAVYGSSLPAPTINDILNDPTAREVIEVFRDFFENPKMQKIWHNYGFDRHVLQGLGLKVSGFGGDTLHMARLYDASRKLAGGYSLESLSGDKEVSHPQCDECINCAGCSHLAQAQQHHGKATLSRSDAQAAAAEQITSPAGHYLT
jgi:hypothetical protein